MNKELWDLIRSQPEHLLLTRDFLIELFMAPMRTQLPDDTTFSQDGQSAKATLVSPPLYKGKLFEYKGKFWVCQSHTRRYDPPKKTYVEDVVATPLNCPVPTDHKPILSGQTPVTLVYGDLPCIKKDDPPIQTTFGRYLLHATLVAPLFKGYFPYLNKEIKFSDFREMIIHGFSEKLITADQLKPLFIDRFCFLTYMTELNVPGLTRKALAKPKSFAEARDKMCKEYEAALARGEGTAMVRIEKALEAMNRDYMKGDKAEHIFIDKKSAMSQKQLFLTTGLLEVFGEPGKVTFVSTPLADGWKKHDVVALNNEARQGSYFRGIETANGGEDAKYVSLVLQDTYIVQPDCGTTEGEIYEPNIHNYKKLVGKYTVGKDAHPATIEELLGYVDKKIELRAPTHCRSKFGFCARCMGLIFEVTGQEAISMAVKNLSSKFTSAALKKIHATEKQLYTITDLNRFRAKN